MKPEIIHDQVQHNPTQGAVNLSHEAFTPPKPVVPVQVAINHPADAHPAVSRADAGQTGQSNQAAHGADQAPRGEVKGAPAPKIDIPAAQPPIAEKALPRRVFSSRDSSPRQSGKE